MLQRTDRSIRVNMALGSLGALSVALVLGVCVSLGYQYLRLRQSLSQEIVSVADLVAGEGYNAVKTKDTAAIESWLSILRLQSEIVDAEILDLEGQSLGRLEEGVPTAPAVLEERDKGVPLESGNAYFAVPISAGSKRVGTLVTEANLRSPLTALVREHLLLGGGLLAGSILVSLIIASMADRRIAAPMRALTGTMKATGDSWDFSARSDGAGPMEVGAIAHEFNEMLDKLERRMLKILRVNAGQQENQGVAHENTVESTRSQQRYEVAVSGSTDGLWDWDLESGAAFYSPRWKSMLGHDDDEISDHYEEWESRLHPEDKESTLEVLQEYLAGETDAFEVEFRLRHKSGHHVWILSRGSAFRDGDGKPLRMAGLQTDITERKNAENELRCLNQRLLEASRQAGMAEVATGVLHNVGNVLNSVNVSTTLIADNIRKSRAGRLQKAVALLEEHSGDLAGFLTDDPKGKQWHNYLSKLAKHLNNERATIEKEIGGLRRNLDHIRDIVTMQQSYASVSGVIESQQLSGLVEDALAFSSGALEQHGIQVVRDYADLPHIPIDKHRVLQILNNLIRNAIWALVERGGDDKQLRLQIQETELATIEISVGDNGVGIPPEGLTRVFQHGYTTKKLGHGFGLHSGALAAQDMGGSLTAHSGGIGMGAIFTLELPYDSKKTMKHAA